MATITLTGDYGHTQYKVSSGIADGTVFDAYQATFHQDNDDSDGVANPYPVSIWNYSNLIIQGGTILGNVNQTLDWEEIYHNRTPGNSAGVVVRDTPGVTIRDWRIDGGWDGIRVTRDSATSKGSDGFIIEDVWVTNNRDDVIENDKLQTGIIRDSLFDGNFGGISLDPSSSNPVDGTGESVTIDGVLLRMKSYLSEGKMTHTSPFKLDNDLPMPDLHIVDSVVAIENVHHSTARLVTTWENLVESHGNVFLNLSDELLPTSYPLPPPDWIVLQGQAARDYWTNARDAWVSRHADLSLPTDDVPDQAPPLPPPPELAPTFTTANYTGKSSAETIVGNSLANVIDGKAGTDTIHGNGNNDTIVSGTGADQLWGDAGNDTFLFRKVSDSRGSYGIDTIKDFARGEDKIDVHLIDANESRTGDQAFALTDGAPRPGELSVRYDASTGMTVIDANVDADRAAEFTIDLAGKHDLTSHDFIL